MDSEIKSIDMDDMKVDATSFTWAVDSAIRSGTMSNLGDSRVHSFASVVDSAIKSGTASTLETSLVHSFSSLLDTAIKSDTAPSFGTSRVHSFASRVRRDQLSHSMTHYDNDSSSGDHDDDDDDEHDGDDHDDDEEDEDDLSDIDKSKSSPSGTDTKKEPPVPKDVPTPKIAAQDFRFRELAAATKNFRPECLLGEGGFGPVYKGRLESTGQVVAIKQLDRSGRQGNRQFIVEVITLSILHHPNLVDMIGYCADGDQRLLVYEFMPKGSLENHLFRRGFYLLSWCLRMKIALDAAKGLAFIHSTEPKVVHCDFNTSNILLDANYNAKLSDFGLARDGPTGDRSRVFTRVMGTSGYIAPDYIATGHLTTKSDVYSFGVVLLEMISGRRALDTRRPTGEHNLVDWAEPYICNKRRVLRVMDPRLEGQYSVRQARAAAALALQCLALDPKLRPNMDEVVKALEHVQE